MRILKEGNPERMVKRGVCRRCGCEFEMSYDEFHKREVKTLSLIMVTCPQCECDDLKFENIHPSEE